MENLLLQYLPKDLIDCCILPYIKPTQELKEVCKEIECMKNYAKFRQIKLYYFIKKQVRCHPRGVAHKNGFCDCLNHGTIREICDMMEMVKLLFDIENIDGYLDDMEMKNINKTKKKTKNKNKIKRRAF